MQFDQLKRREFITLLGGTAAAWPLPVRAQQRAMPVVGFFSLGSPGAFADQLRALRTGLKGEGFEEGGKLHLIFDGWQPDTIRRGRRRPS
jgi:hypothetical protein